MNWKLAPLGAALIAVSASLAPAMSGGTEPDPSDRRYDAVGALLLTTHLGRDCPVAPAPGGPVPMRGTCVLVAPDVIITMQHVFTGCQSTNPFWARFRRNVDCTVGTQDCPGDPGGGEESYHQVRVACWALPNGLDGTDPVIFGFLEQPITHIKPIAIDFDQSSLAEGQMVTVTGWGITGGQGSSMLDLRTADREILFLTPDQVILNPAIPGEGFRDGDSGGPFLAPTGPNGELRVIGLLQPGGAAERLHNYAPILFRARGTTSGTCPLRYNFSCPACNIGTPTFLLPAWEECIADANRDGAVDFDDLNLVLGNFGAGCAADANFDGATDFDDLNLVLGNFGSVCAAGAAIGGATECVPTQTPPLTAPQDGDEPLEDSELLMRPDDASGLIVIERQDR